LLRNQGAVIKNRTIFQQEWWLDCVTNGRYAAVTASSGGQVVGWLPYMVQRRWGFSVSEIPHLTHTLGPVIAAGAGRPNSQLLRSYSITAELLAGLPPLAYFRQVLAPSQGEALAYQAAGFAVRVQFTFIADCADIDGAWKNMRDKTRNLIRRSEERDTVTAGDQVDEFLEQYAVHCASRDRVNRYDRERTGRVLRACIERDQGKVFFARDGKSGQVNGGIFVVWDDSSMYYLMSTRSSESPDNGAISLLLWKAMNEAHVRGLKFDFDGVSSAGSFRFLSGFGGTVARRLVVEKFNMAYHAMDKVHAFVRRSGNLRRHFG
jgi:hypothetical protein